MYTIVMLTSSSILSIYIFEKTSRQRSSNCDRWSPRDQFIKTGFFSATKQKIKTILKGSIS